MTFLAAEALDFGCRHARDANFRQGFTYVVQLERFDDGFDLLLCWALTVVAERESAGVYPSSRPHAERCERWQGSPLVARARRVCEPYSIVDQRLRGAA